jgi:penicillin V acylase-like amidase (Ntn superfamily)
MVKRFLNSIIGLMLLTVNSSTDACTIIMLSKNDVVLVGNNEDARDPYTCYWIIPPSNDEYGRICFGFTDPFENPQGGLNDQGLFIDANAIASTGWQPVEGKPDFKGSVMEHILAYCANVEEAIAFFKENNVRYLNNGRFPIADRTGASVVVEYHRAKSSFSEKMETFRSQPIFSSLITNQETILVTGTTWPRRCSKMRMLTLWTWPKPYCLPSTMKEKHLRFTRIFMI